MGTNNSKQYRKELLEAFNRIRTDKEKALTLLRNTKKPAEIRSDDNWTLLHCAAAKGWTDVCQQLVELYQVDIHVKENIGGCTALHLACIYNHTDTVKYLVSHAHCDPLIENDDGYTPFDRSYGESEVFLQDIIDKAEKEGLTVVEYTKSVSSHGGNHPVIDYAPYLERAAAQGTVTTRLSSIGLFGAAGTGKTSTARLLTDQEPVYEHDSTPVMKTKEYYKASKQDVLIAEEGKIKEWMPATEKVLIHRLGNCVATLADLEQQAGTAQGTDSVDHSSSLIDGFSINESKAEVQPISSVGSDKAGASVTPPTASATHQQDDPHACVSNVTQNILEFVKSREDLKKLGITHFVSMCDTGGQAAFMDIAPALLSLNSVNLILLKLNERLDDPAKFFYSVKGQTVGYENRQITTRSLVYSMVSCKSKIMPPRIEGKLTEGSQFQKPVFMILGTHLDEYKKMEASGNPQSEAEKNSHLKHDLAEFKDFLLYSDEDTLIFSVDTLARDDETKELASEIRKLVMERYVQVEIPVSWYIFHLAMIEIKQSDLYKDGMISLSALNVVGTMLAQMPPEEVQAALQYFHDLRISLYYPTVASNVVFTDPQFLFDKISEIFAFSQSKGKLGVTMGDFEKLKKTGKFDKNLLGKICKGFNEIFTQSEFLSLLSYLFIVSKIPDTGEYFMPSLLAEHPDPCAEFLTSPSIEPLLLSWDASVPNGLFTSLTTSIQAVEGVNSIRFTMSPSDEQYRNVITLNCPDLACQVKLIECTAFVAVAVLFTRSEEFKVTDQCVKLRRVIMSCIGKIGEKFNWMPLLAYPEEAFLCKIEQCIAQGDIHFCYLDASRRVISCAKSSLIIAPAHPDSHLVWWGELGSSLDHSNHLTLLNMFNLLQHKSSRWSDIGRAFDVSDNDRDSLRRNPAITDKDRLEKVLSKWLESAIEPTWAKIYKILTDSLNFNDIARRMMTFLDQQ